MRDPYPMGPRFDAAGRLLPEQGEGITADVLRAHYLAEIVCDHERKMDNPRCACSLVHLGWHPSVGRAVDAWIAHVLSVAGKGTPMSDPETMMVCGRCGVAWTAGHVCAPSPAIREVQHGG